MKPYDHWDMLEETTDADTIMELLEQTDHLADPSQDFPRADWQAAVAGGDTVSGFWLWLANNYLEQKIEADDDDAPPDCVHEARLMEDFSKLHVEPGECLKVKRCRNNSCRQLWAHVFIPHGMGIGRRFNVCHCILTHNDRGHDEVKLPDHLIKEESNVTEGTP